MSEAHGATPFESDIDLRVFARAVLNEHDPVQQPDNGYNRCALCHYTRHPCDTYDLAAIVLALLDRDAPTAPGYAWGSHLPEEEQRWT